MAEVTENDPILDQDEHKTTEDALAQVHVPEAEFVRKKRIYRKKAKGPQVEGNTSAIL